MRAIPLSLAIALAAMPAAAQDGGRATALATFAAGCFWCMEGPFDKLPGVEATISGYTGGHVANPNYKQVSAGGTGHTEAVQIRYDPTKVSYEKLLDIFWRNVDPFDGSGQFCDRGDQYRPAIFIHDEQQKALAERSKAEIVKRFPEPVAVTVEPAPTFYPAEEYHQDYYKKNPVQYTFYRYACGRDARLDQLWGPSG